MLILIAFVAFVAFMAVDGFSTTDKLLFYRFSPTLWHQMGATQRYFMAQYLIDKGLLIGRSHAEVSQMLGDQLKPGYFRDRDTWAYELARTRGAAWDTTMDMPPIFAIDFGPDEKVRSVEIYSHS